MIQLVYYFIDSTHLLLRQLLCSFLGHIGHLNLLVELLDLIAVGAYPVPLSSSSLILHLTLLQLPRQLLLNHMLIH